MEQNTPTCYVDFDNIKVGDLFLLEPFCLYAKLGLPTEKVQCAYTEIRRYPAKGRTLEDMPTFEDYYDFWVNDRWVAGDDDDYTVIAIDENTITLHSEEVSNGVNIVLTKEEFLVSVSWEYIQERRKEILQQRYDYEL